MIFSSKSTTKPSAAGIPWRSHNPLATKTGKGEARAKGKGGEEREGIGGKDGRERARKGVKGREKGGKSGRKGGQGERERRGCSGFWLSFSYESITGCFEW